MNKNLDINNSLKETLKISNHFFCISHFNGDLSWVKYIKKGNYIIYNKSGKKLKDNYLSKDVKNFGYNIYSYLRFIHDNYDNLPEIIVFCKDNIFKRHIKEETFSRLLKNKNFSSLEEVNLRNLKPLINIHSSDHGYLELNNSWYKNYFPRKYFANFNKFYNFIFISKLNPQYIRFAPGGNYVVPKENVLLRSKNFYANLIKFLEYNELSCESHFLERSLITIWNSNVQSTKIMDFNLTQFHLDLLVEECNLDIKRESYLVIKLKNLLLYFLSKIYAYMLKIFLKN